MRKLSVGGYLVVGWDGSRRYHIGHFDEESRAIAAANQFELAKESWPRVGQRERERPRNPVITRVTVAERTGLETMRPGHHESDTITPPPSFNDLLESMAHPIRLAHRSWPESWPGGSVVVDISSEKFPAAVMLCDRVMALAGMNACYQEAAKRCPRGYRTVQVVDTFTPGVLSSHSEKTLTVACY